MVINASTAAIKIHPPEGHGTRLGTQAIDKRFPPGLHRSRLTPSGRRRHQRRWRLAIPTFLLLGPCQGELTGIAHVVPGGLDPAVGTLDVGDAELVDVAVEGIGDAVHAGAGLRGPGTPRS